MSGNHAFDVFLSHNSQDQPVVRELKRALEAEGLSCLPDMDDPASGETSSPSPTNGGHDAALIAVCIGPAGTGSWENEDMQDFLAQAVEQKKRIVPVLLPGAPEKPKIPMFLNNRAWIDLRSGLNEEGLAQLIESGADDPKAPPQPENRAVGNVRVDNSHIAKSAPRHLFGREAELERLDRALADPKIRVYTLIAWGGVGKTSLAMHWMARLAEDGWRGLERVYAWSFYSQGGAKDHGPASSDAFFTAAFAFFGDTDPATADLAPGDKGVRLARLIAEHHTLLVLDGLEPLQHPPGLLNGRLKDQAIEALLTTLAQAPKTGVTGGLCLVTSREPVKELEGLYETTASECRLEHLSEHAGAALLHSLGVDRAGAVSVAADDIELRQASREFGGHALTLRVLGLYLAKAHRGDVRKRDTVELAQADLRYKTNPADRDQPYGYAFKAMAAYEYWLAENGSDGARQLALLRLLGLFDRPADPGCLAALREPPVIAGLTEPLFVQQQKAGGVLGLSRRHTPIAETEWNELVSDLEAAGLVQTVPYAPKPMLGYGEDIAHKRMDAFARREHFPLGAPQAFTPPATDHEAPMLDAHPLLREYFGRRLRDTSPEAWREGHGRLYRHLTASTPYWPEGEAGLLPLYQAVNHGCHAGLYRQACDEVYINRIARRGEGYAIHKLGLFAADLGALACFFDSPWTSPAPELPEARRTWLLHQAAFRLRALGRPIEALEPMQAGLEMRIKQEAWPNAARLAGNLSELALTLGKLDEAAAYAGRAVDYAERSGDVFQRMGKHTTLADVLHQAGRRNEALERFRESETLQAKRQPGSPMLYSMPGFRYCDLLLADAERQAWRFFLASPAHPSVTDEQVEEIATACLAIAERAAWTLTIAKNNHRLLHIALDHLTLGRAALYGALLILKSGGTPDYDGKNAADTLEESRAHVNAAVHGLRAAGTMDHLPRVLLTRAWLSCVEGGADAEPALDTARADLDEAQRIAERGAMRLHLADIHLHRARLFRDRDALAKARRLIVECGYGRRREELSDAEAAAREW
jgi:hypothetical protein